MKEELSNKTLEEFIKENGLDRKEELGKDEILEIIDKLTDFLETVSKVSFAIAAEIFEEPKGEENESAPSSTLIRVRPKKGIEGFFAVKNIAKGALKLLRKRGTPIPFEVFATALILEASTED